LNSDNSSFLGANGSIIGCNLLAYCENNPINYSDENGSLSLKKIGETFKKIFSWGEKICDFLLGQFGISKRKYAKMKYKDKKELYDFVLKNKAKIKSISNKTSSISNFLEILLVVSESVSCIKKHKKEALAIAEILFDGLIRFIGYVVGKIISWIIKKISILLFWLKFAIEWLFEYIVDKFLEGKLVQKVKAKYLNHVDASKLTFVGLFIALFKGVKSAM